MILGTISKLLVNLKFEIQKLKTIVMFSFESENQKKILDNTFQCTVHHFIHIHLFCLITHTNLVKPML